MVSLCLVIFSCIKCKKNNTVICAYTVHVSHPVSTELNYLKFSNFVYNCRFAREKRLRLWKDYVSTAPIVPIQNKEFTAKVM